MWRFYKVKSGGARNRGIKNDSQPLFQLEEEWVRELKEDYSCARYSEVGSNLIL